MRHQGADVFDAGVRGSRPRDGRGVGTVVELTVAATWASESMWVWAWVWSTKTSWPDLAPGSPGSVTVVNRVPGRVCDPARAGHPLPTPAPRAYTWPPVGTVEGLEDLPG